MPALRLSQEERDYFGLANVPARQWHDTYVRPTQTQDTAREIAEQTGVGVEPPLGRFGIATEQAARSMQQFSQAANWWSHSIGIGWGERPIPIRWTTFDNDGIIGRFPAEWSRHGQPDVRFQQSTYDSARRQRETTFIDDSHLIVTDSAIGRGLYRGIFLDGPYAGRVLTEREYTDLFSIRTVGGRRVVHFAEPVQFSIRRGDLTRYEPPTVHTYEAQIYEMPPGATPCQFVVMRVR